MSVVWAFFEVLTRRRKTLKRLYQLVHLQEDLQVSAESRQQYQAWGPGLDGL